MKKNVMLLLAIALLANLLIPQTENWKKFASGALSFKYPPRWQVKQNESHIAISNDPRKEELLILAVPFDETQTPTQLAWKMINMFKANMPDIKAMNFQEKGAENVFFETTYSEGGTPFRAEVLLIRDTQSAFWFSYTAPAKGYDQKYALTLLTQFMSTISTGGDASPTGAVPNPANLEKNARAFLFTLEFALGAPFTYSQEQLILGQLLDGWKKDTLENLRKFDRFPELAAAILRAGQHDLETLRAELQQTTSEWLNESDASDPVVQIVRRQLNMKEKVIIAGEPPLTEMAADAYSEMTVYAASLAQNPNAAPSQITPAQTSQIRNQLKNQWNAFSKEEKKNILTTPGLWMTFRTLLQYGATEEKEKIKHSILKLAPRTPSSQTSPTGAPKPMPMISHQVLMNMQQQTFNHYMWSRGFKSTIFGY